MPMIPGSISIFHIFFKKPNKQRRLYEGDKMRTEENNFDKNDFLFSCA